MNTTVAVTAITAVSVQSLVPWALIATGKLRTHNRSRKTTAAEAVRVRSPVPAPAAGKPALLQSVPPQRVATVVADANERTRKGLPRLRPLEQTRNPKLAAYARGRERDPITGHWLSRNEAS